jgi:uncharacterized protein (DUF342 family)
MDYGIFKDNLKKVKDNGLPTKIIEGDLTESESPLIFDGNVVVTGKILPNSIIEASGDVITPYFEFAQVYAKGKFYADLITGAGNDRYAIVRAKEGVYAGLIQYSNVISYKDVIVSEEVRHSDIFAESFVKVDGGVIGGLVSGYSGIEADFFGLESKIETKIVAGYSRRLSAELESKNKELEEIKSKIKICESYLDKVKNEEKLNELNCHHNELIENSLKLESEIDNIKNTLKIDLNPEIKVNVEVNENVQIAIYNKAMIMENKISGTCKFLLEDEKIKIYEV